MPKLFVYFDMLYTYQHFAHSYMFHYFVRIIHICFTCSQISATFIPCKLPNVILYVYIGGKKETLYKFILGLLKVLKYFIGSWASQWGRSPKTSNKLSVRSQLNSSYHSTYLPRCGLVTNWRKKVAKTNITNWVN